MAGRAFEDEPQSGRPVAVAAPEIATKVHDKVMDDRRVTERQSLCCWDFSGLSSFHSTGRSGYEKLSTRWVPRLLTIDQNHTRQDMSRANLNLFQAYPESSDYR